MDEVKAEQDKRIKLLEKQVYMHKKNEQALKQKIRMGNKVRVEKPTRMSEQDSQLQNGRGDLQSSYAYQKLS